MTARTGLIYIAVCIVAGLCVAVPYSFAAETETVIPAPLAALMTCNTGNVCNSDDCEDYGESRCVELHHCAVGHTSEVETTYVQSGDCHVTCCDGTMILSTDDSCATGAGRCIEIVYDKRGNVTLPGGLVIGSGLVDDGDPVGAFRRWLESIVDDSDPILTDFAEAPDDDMATPTCVPSMYNPVSCSWGPTNEEACTECVLQQALEVRQCRGHMTRLEVHEALWGLDACHGWR